MLPDRVSNPGPLTYESGALPIALRGPAHCVLYTNVLCSVFDTGDVFVSLHSFFRHLGIRTFAVSLFIASSKEKMTVLKI